MPEPIEEQVNLHLNVNVDDLPTLPRITSISSIASYSRVQTFIPPPIRPHNGGYEANIGRVNKLVVESLSGGSIPKERGCGPSRRAQTGVSLEDDEINS